jgi:PKD repeat protein
VQQKNNLNSLSSIDCHNYNFSEEENMKAPIRYRSHFKILSICFMVLLMLGIQYSNVSAQTPCTGNPFISVLLQNRSVYLEGFGETVTIEVYDENGVLRFEDSEYPMEEYEETVIRLNVPKILAGWVIDVVDNGTGCHKTLTVEHLGYREFDFENGIIKGVGPHGRRINLYKRDSNIPYEVIWEGPGEWTAYIEEEISVSDKWQIVLFDNDNDETTLMIRKPTINVNRTFKYFEFRFLEEGIGRTIYVDDDGIDYQEDYYEKFVILYDDSQPLFHQPFGNFVVEPGMVVTSESCGLFSSIEVVDFNIDPLEIGEPIVSGTGPDGYDLNLIYYQPDWAVRIVPIENGTWLADFSVPGSTEEEQDVIDSFTDETAVAVHWLSENGNLIEVDIWMVSADAGGPYTADEGDPVILNGSNSTSLEANIVLYEWDLDGDGAYDDATGITTPAFYEDNGVYSVGLRVTDEVGLSDTDTTEVNVINVAPTVGEITAPLDPVQVGSPIQVSAPFSDPGADNWTAEWDWGNGDSTSGSFNGNVVSGNYTYDTPGVYTITLTVTDDDGGVGSAVYRYIVVYDPEGGFVTGGGWIWSPLGAYPADASLEGKATFGFVSKYKKGADVPSGVTEFQFKLADLNFHSDSYEWLVVAGPRAQFKGVGTINGEGEFKFMLTAIDGEINGGGDVDKFRIKIWYEESDGIEIVVYDNQIGEVEDAEPATELGGGSIVIHKAK